MKPDSPRRKPSTRASAAAAKPWAQIESGEFYRQLLADLQAAGALTSSGVEYAPYSDAPVDTEVLALMRKTAPAVGKALSSAKPWKSSWPRRSFMRKPAAKSATLELSPATAGSLDVFDMKRTASRADRPCRRSRGRQSQLPGDRATASLDAARRKDIIRNHTATHLLHAALRNSLGKHVQQRGSLVAPDRLRFRLFAPGKSLRERSCAKIADEVNRAILSSTIAYMAKKSRSKKRGAKAPWRSSAKSTATSCGLSSSAAPDDRYSYELCGGVHVGGTAEIGSFVFTSEGSVSAGIRRVEALTGRAASAYFSRQLQIPGTYFRERLGIGARSGGTPRIADLQAGAFGCDSGEIENLRRRQARHDFDSMINESIGKPKRCCGRWSPNSTIRRWNTMREMTDWFRNRESTTASWCSPAISTAGRKS